MHEAPERSGVNGLDTLETIPDAVPTVFTEPPIEDQLAWHTLWPESHKLYGHGNELFSLCCDHKGELVASSCKVCSVSLNCARCTCILLLLDRRCSAYLYGNPCCLHIL